MGKKEGHRLAEEEVVSSDELAELLGVSPRTIQRMAKDKILYSVSEGRENRFNLSESISAYVAHICEQKMIEWWGINEEELHFFFADYVNKKTTLALYGAKRYMEIFVSEVMDKLATIVTGMKNKEQVELAYSEIERAISGLTRGAVEPYRCQGIEDKPAQVGKEQRGKALLEEALESLS